MDKLFLTNDDCGRLAERLWVHGQDACGLKMYTVYGVPRGGIPVAYLVKAFASELVAVADKPEQADVIVDDIVDSGRTRERFSALYKKPFLALCDYLAPGERAGRWVVFPWEKQADGVDTSADDIVVRLLQHIGERPEREGLQETPQRVLRAWKEMTKGYGQDAGKVLKCFEDGSENYDEMVTVKDLPFYSQCEHHLLPFFGTATIAYVPNKRIVGLSKLGRVLEIYARRLQVQERLTAQIADALQNALDPRGVGVLIRARHLCMESRGLATQGHHTVTTALRGVFLEDGKARSEFLSIA